MRFIGSARKPVCTAPGRCEVGHVAHYTQPSGFAFPSAADLHFPSAAERCFLILLWRKPFFILASKSPYLSNPMCSEAEHGVICEGRKHRLRRCRTATERHTCPFFICHCILHPSLAFPSAAERYFFTIPAALCAASSKPIFFPQIRPPHVPLRCTWGY